MSRRLVNVLLLVGVVVLVGACLLFGAPHSSGGEGEKFGGTDAAVSEQIDSTGYTPWFQPIFSPGSGEVESGLFALQAAIGGGILGYCIGALHTRSRLRRHADERLTTPTPTSTSPIAGAGGRAAPGASPSATTPIEPA